MNKQPVYLLISVWLTCTLIFLLLPFQLLNKQVSPYGVLMLFAFILAFICGSVLVPTYPATAISSTPATTSDYSWAERLLICASLIAIVAFAIDIAGQDLFNIAHNQELRSQRADALLNSTASVSSTWFRIAFVFYPASYVYIVSQLVYSPRISYMKLFLFGWLPLILATVAMGGRLPMLYAFVLTTMAFLARRKHLAPLHSTEKKTNTLFKRVIIVFVVASILMMAIYYFSLIFLVRSEVVGGPAAMFSVARSTWGIGFNGPFSQQIFAVFGENLSYLIFVFFWYLVQGIVIATYIFTGYDGPLQLGVYGIDIVSAVMRRIDPDQVAHGFSALISLGTYGFLPSAFGSLFVDFGIFGLFLSGLWGYLATLCYRKIQFDKEGKWFLIGPFVSTGILFSLINTPIGVANGFITHLWMLLAFSALRSYVQPAYPAGNT